MNIDVWIMDTLRGNLRRLTSNLATEGFPVWSPDGQRFLFNTPLQDDTTPPITVILNWKPPTP